jgi:2,3-bisphosphoglycerate-independent phosphoglycerate mutase
VGRRLHRNSLLLNDRGKRFLERAASEAGWLLVMTADHGNAEQMVDPATGQPHTAHTTNPVPFVVCRRDLALAPRGDGTLADVAPTVLGLPGIVRA